MNNKLYYLRIVLKAILITIFVGVATLVLLLTLTNLSFPGTLANYILPPLISLLLPPTFILILCLRTGIWEKIVGGITTLFSLLCAWITPLILLIMLIPPFTLAFLFMMDEAANEIHQQTVYSPDGSRAAEVYFRGVGAYSGGMGRMEVRVHPTWLPWIESVVYLNGSSDYGEGTTNYAAWKNNQELIILDSDEPVPADQFFFDPDLGIALPTRFASSIWHSIFLAIQTRDISAFPVPSQAQSDEIGFASSTKTQYRRFEINLPADSIADWFVTELPADDWKIGWVKPDTDSSYMENTTYCLMAVSENRNNPISPVFIKIDGYGEYSAIEMGGPDPQFERCDRYIHP